MGQLYVWGQGKLERAAWREVPEVPEVEGDMYVRD